MIKSNWNYLINPPHMNPTKNSEARKNCKWSPPPPGWYKLNFDGASRGNPGLSGIGCIINNEDGQWLLKRAKLINPTSNNLAELEAVLEGIKLCLKLGLTKVIIEGDSQIVINALRKKSTPNWVLNSKLDEIIKLMEDLETFQLIHIFREGNTIADKLANLGADGSNFIKINNLKKV
jgi:ribonuclease HI